MSDKTQLIDIEGLKVFKEQYDLLVDEKISQIVDDDTTYTLSKNESGEIVLTGSDGSTTSVTDENTTYVFEETNHVLTITGSDGTTKNVNLGSEITAQEITDALGFEPIGISSVPTTLSGLTDDATHRLVTDAEKETWNAKLDSFTEEDPTVPAYVKAITEDNISSWNAKAEVSQIPTKASDIGALPDTTDLSVYALVEDAGYSLNLSVDDKTYEMTLELKNKDGSVLSTKSVDLPIESMVVSAEYKDGTLTLMLQSGETLDVDISAIVGGLVNDSFTIAGIDMKDDITAEELKTALGVPTVTDTYSATSTDAMSGVAVADAISGFVKISYDTDEPTLDAGDIWVQDYE